MTPPAPKPQKEWPALVPGYYLATHPSFRPAVVEFCHDAATGIDPHWRNAQDNRMSVDPRDCGHELTPITKGRNAIAADTRSGSQGVVDDAMVERFHAAFMAQLHFLCQPDRGDVFSFVDDQKDAMRAALLAAMGGREDGWIACSERMPELGQYVLVYTRGGIEEEIKSAAYHKIFASGWAPVWWDGISSGSEPTWMSDPSNKKLCFITHWRPLPPPPTTISEERSR